MQYLSQRLAPESTRTREDERPLGPVALTQHERILAASEQLIAEKGSSGATIEAIVKLAGVSSVTFYEHFEDKEGCFVAAFDRALEEALATLRAAAPAGLPWPDQIRSGLGALVDAIAAEPARARMCLVEAQMGGPQLRARYAAALDGAAAKLREGRRLESSPAGLADSLEEATAGGLAWLLRERLELGGGGSMEDLLPRMVDIALSPYLGDCAAPPALVAEPTPGDG